MPSKVNICRQNFEILFIISRVIQENVVFGGHFEFSRANRKQILRTKIFHMCMLSIVIICRWNFENLFISSRVIQENVVLGGHFEFYRANRKWILRPNIFHMCMPSIVNICRWNFENLSISSRVIQENVVFIGHFEFFRPNRKWISKT